MQGFTPDAIRKDSRREHRDIAEREFPLCVLCELYGKIKSEISLPCKVPPPRNRNEFSSSARATIIVAALPKSFLIGKPSSAVCSGPPIHVDWRSMGATMDPFHGTRSRVCRS